MAQDNERRKPFQGPYRRLADKEPGYDRRATDDSAQSWGQLVAGMKHLGFLGNKGPEEKSLQDVVTALWVARRPMVIGALAGGVLALAFIVLAIPQYSVEVLLSPAEPLDRAGMPSMIENTDSQALRYLVRLSGAPESSAFNRFENIMKGVSVAQLLLQDQKILDGVRADVRFVFSQNPQIEAPEKMAAYIEKNVTMEPVSGTGMRRMAYLHHDPVFAKYFIGT